ncbi:hypothetical protein H7Y21_01065 [Arenimonas sp.]|nr:hypothetical protein [Candidatus Parcubacteria bacterium]
MDTHHQNKSKFKLKSRVLLGELQTPSIVKILVNKKIVRSEKQAVIAVLSLLFILVAVSAFFVGKSFYIPIAKISPALITSNQ